MLAGLRRVAPALAGARLFPGSPPADRAGLQGGAPPDTHTSRNSLDWSGTYEGVILCADCPRTAMRLTLDSDGGYVLTTWPLTRADSPATVRGSFTWLPAGDAIALDAT